jgi:hypothetical protein
MSMRHARLIATPGRGGANCTGRQKRAPIVPPERKGGCSCVSGKQLRGVAHLHGVVSVATPAELAWARVYVKALEELVPCYGFGYVDGWDKISRKLWPGTQAAAYLSSYFARGRGNKATITENVLDPDLPRLVVFIGRDLTQQTGCTMRSLRNARRLWAARHGYIEPPRFEYAEWLAAAAMLTPRPATRAP